MGSSLATGPKNRWASSFWSEWVGLGIAILWGFLGMLVVLNLHVNPEHQTNIEGQVS
jgi:hypothetical protein